MFYFHENIQFEQLKPFLFILSPSSLYEENEVQDVIYMELHGKDYVGGGGAVQKKQNASGLECEIRFFIKL